jgi:membrane protease YdiL (CAAX protease family)
MDGQLSDEFDTGVAEDEIVAGAGHYSLGTVPGTTWKALVIIGSITTLAGIALEFMTRGWIYPVADYYPTPLGSGLVLSVLVAGLLSLGVGLGLRRQGAREPPLEPIV